MNFIEAEGQWIGESSGDPSGNVILDIDADGNALKCTATLLNDSEIPSTTSDFTIPNIFEERFKSPIIICALYPDQGRTLSHHEVEKFNPEVSFASTANIHLSRVDHNEIEFSWDTEIKTSGSGKLYRSQPPKVSIIEIHEQLSWSRFRTELLTNTFRDFIFRGQTSPHPLQTSFHRTTRSRLNEFLNQDIVEIHRTVAARTNMYFDIHIPDQLGALMNLAQHHGYPTPLLDWSYSPFVAAWFAFSEAKRKEMNDGFVRIFCFDAKKYKKDVRQYQTLTNAPMHFSLLETFSIENDRSIPQQGLFSLTNVRGIESFIHKIEERQGTRYCYAFDVAISDTDTALNDLAMMGITRSTMFPGLESSLLDLRQRNF